MPDWNYTQYQVNNGVRLPDWKVQFNLAQKPTKGSIATLTIALSDRSLDIPGLPFGTPFLPGTLTVIVNGIKLPAWVLKFIEERGLFFLSPVLLFQHHEGMTLAFFRRVKKEKSLVHSTEEE